jgi:hypothetical protein
MFKPQYLVDSRQNYMPSARHCAIGRTWLDITKRPTKRYSVAEKIAHNFRVDRRSVITRVLQVKGA